MNAYDNWLAYALGCTDNQLRVVWEDESNRMKTTPNDEVLVDSMAAMAACSVVAAQRGMLL